MGEVRDRFKDVVVKRKKSKKGKKKKRRIVHEVRSSVEFNESDFFSGYIDQMFKDEQSLKKLNSIEEFNRTGISTKGSIYLNNDF